MGLFSSTGSSVQRRLTDVQRQLVRARAELAVLDEQAGAVHDVYDDVSTDALVSENPAARREASEAKKHVDHLVRRRGELVGTIAGLEVRMDELIDRLPAG